MASNSPYNNAAATAAYGQAYSNHYAQAYTQHGTTPQGYAVSSTYTAASSSSSSRSMDMGAASWYQTGSSRCTYKNCVFTGSQKSVETHMMDRHLIFPPGWDKQKKTDNWDADPSLKGKPMPIQGTTLVLDSPEILDAWLAERKKRWPSDKRVQEKKRKQEEAVARGQLSVEELGLFSRKRQRTVDNEPRPPTRGRQRVRGHVRGAADSGWRGRGGAVNAHSTPVQPRVETVSSSSESDSSDNGEPEVLSSKVTLNPVVDDPPTLPPKILAPINRPLLRKPLQHPPPAQPTLLRNLLLPEIRMTVSNLSQAIRFLVRNDFLRDVELKPGEADEKMIQVIGTDELQPRGQL
ncbi:uncharacterized protein BT62DRAFT_1001248 [Guyanagaster necrorhizus]|uniref:FMR1-interacting protein 1 conserved domain-containing protein n=1 Tax=Guyanagaster necrorhizus TaxID=856835 RepID=A0A9P8AWC2_9AGAR|nr:uncharacterized protein BT62DRAFT_1001248 [Guyanagaster necrorhizus MCA 3950]KAG7450423.1 hypothetical protein BT62DRAFT_1001248 [Guyanagaster necrorhizus MCA 3950]